MIHLRTALILLGLLGASVALADPGTGSGTGLKFAQTKASPVAQTSPADSRETAPGK